MARTGTFFIVLLIALAFIGADIAFAEPYVFRALPDVEIDEDSDVVYPMTLDLNFRDTEDREMDYTAENDPAELNLRIYANSVLGIEPDPDYNLPDGIDIIITAENDIGETAVDTFRVIVNPINDAPVVANPINQFSIDEDDERTIIADLNDIFSDADLDEGDVLTFSYAGDPQEIAADLDENDVFSVLPDANYNNTDGIIITLSAEDNSGEVTDHEFSLFVNPVNDQPFLTNEIPDVTIDEDAAGAIITDLDNNFDDVDIPGGDELSFSVINAPAGLNLTVNENNELSYAADENFYTQNGIDITVRATDTAGEFFEDIFTFTVNPSADPPEIAGVIDDVNLNEDPGFFEIADLTQVFIDPDDEQLNYAIEGDPDNMNLSINGNTLSLDPVENYHTDNNPVEITIIAVDGTNQSVEVAFNVTISSVNDLPERVRTIEDVQIDEDAGQVLIDDLDEVFSDVDDDDDLTFSFEGRDELNLVINNNNVLLMNADQNFNYPQGLEVIVFAEDAAGEIATDSIMVSIAEINDNPTVADPIDDLAVGEDPGHYEIADLDIVFHDPDLEDVNPDVLTFTVEGAFEEFNMAIDENNILYFDPDENYYFDNNLFIIVTAEDQSGQTAEEFFRIRLYPLNDPPLIDNPVVEITIDEDAGITDLVDLDLVFNDIDVNQDGSLDFDFATDIEDFNLYIENNHLYSNTSEHFNIAGGGEITITATDDSLGSSDDVFTLIVTPTPDTPAVQNPIQDVVVNEDPEQVNIVDLDNVFVEYDGEALEFSTTGDPDELNMSIDENNALSFNPDQDYDLPDGIQITVTATDPTDRSISDEFALTIRSVNDSPVIQNAIVELDVNEDVIDYAAIDLNDVFYDPDGDALDFIFTGFPDEIDFLVDDSDILIVTVDENYNLPDGVQVTVTGTDGDEESAEDTFTFYVNPMNDAPQRLAQINDVEVDEDPGRVDVADLDTIFTDLDGDILTYTVRNNPNRLGMAVDEDNILYFEPTLNYNLPEGVEIRTFAWDDSATFASDTFRVVINPIDDPPIVVRQIEDLTIDEGDAATAVATLVFIFEDPEGQDVTYRAENVPDGVQLAIGGNSVATVRPIGNYNNPDGVDITFVATDESGLENTETFNLVVNEVNDAPFVSANIDDFTVDEDLGETIIGDLDNFFDDVDLADDYPDLLTFTFESGVPELNVALNNENILSFNPDPDFNLPDGTVITVTATDDHDVSISQDFTITVQPVNDTPVVNTEINDITVDEDPGRVDIADLDDIFFDVDGDILEFTFADNPPEINLDVDENNILNFNPDLDYNIPNGVDITVTASDQDGEFAADTFNLTINPENDGPVVAEEIADVTVAEDAGQVVIVDLDDVFFDVDDEQLTYDFAGTPAEVHMAINQENQLTINADQNYNLPDGTEITVTADDGVNQIAQDMFRLTITPVNDEPFIADAIGDINIGEDSDEVIVGDLDDVFDDVDLYDQYPDGLGYAFNGATQELNMQIDGDNILRFHPEINYVAPDGIEITVTATDENNAAVVDTFTVTIETANDAPVVANPLPQTMRFNEDSGPQFFAVLDEVFFDVDGDDLTYSFDGATEEMHMRIWPNSEISFHADDNYNLLDGTMITLTADDGNGETIDHSFRLIINPVNDLPFVANEINDLVIDEDSDLVEIVDLNTIFDDIDLGDDYPDEFTFYFEGDAVELNMDITEAGVLTIAPDADYYNEDGLDILVTAVDLGDESAQTSFTITINPQVQVVDVSENSHDFGEILAGETAEWMFTVENLGSQPLELIEVISDHQYFDVDYSQGAVLQRYETEDVIITYAPEVLGQHEGQITVTTNDPQTPEVLVDVTGTTGISIIRTEPEEVDFGNIRIDRIAERELTIFNDGNIDLEIDSITVSNDEFWVQIEEEIREFDWEFEQTDNNMSILILEATLDGTPLTNDDYIGVFTQEDLCVGFRPVVEGESVGFPVWGDDPQTGIVDGLRANEELIFKYWDESANEEFIATPQFIQGNGRYQLNTLQVLNLSYEAGFRVMENPALVIPAQESYTVTVFFQAEQQIDYEESLTIYSSAFADPEFEVRLFGVGGNRAPVVIDQIQSIEINEDHGLYFIADLNQIFDDPDGDELTFSVPDAPEELNVGLPNGDLLTIEPDAHHNITGAGHRVTVVAEDDDGETAETFFTVVINPVPDDPAVANAVQDIVIDEDNGLLQIGNLDDIFFDPDIYDAVNPDVLTFTVSETIAELHLIVDENNLITIQPDANFNMTDPVEVTLTATDNRDVTAEDSFTILVEAVNDTPTVAVEIPDYNIDEDAGLVIVADLDTVFTDTDFDFEGDELGFRFETEIGELNLTISEENLLTFEPDPDFHLADGTEVTVIATDSHDATAEDLFTITITPVNDDPVIANPLNDVVVDEDAGLVEVADLDTVFSDIDGDDLIFNLTGAPQEVNMSINQDNLLSFDADENFNLAGGVEITVSAEDAEEVTVATAFILTINPVNDSPEWIAYQQDVVEVDETDIIEFSFEAQDIDADQLTYTWIEDGISDDAQFTDNGDGTADFTWQTTYEDAGEYHPEFTLSDGEYDLAVTVDIIVIDVNRPPVVVSPIEEFIIDEDSGLSIIASLNDVFNDPDGDDLTFNIDQADDELNLSIDGGENLQIETELDYFGNSVAVISASDGRDEVNFAMAVNANRYARSVSGDQGFHPGRDASNSDQFDVIVNAVNDAPVLDSEITDVVIDEDNGYFEIADLDTVFSDVDDLTLEYSFARAADEMAMEITDGVLSITPQENYNLANGAVITITAADNFDESVSTEFTIQIDPVNDIPVMETAQENVSANETDVVEFDIITSDVDEDELTYRWDLGDIPEEPSEVMETDGTIHFTWNTTYDDAGDYTTTFYTDDGTEEVSVTINIVITNINRAPTIAQVNEGDPFEIDESQLLEFNIIAFDPDVQDLTFEFDRNNLPQDVELIDLGTNRASFSWQTDFEDAGEYSFSAIASDGDLSDTIEVSIIVSDVLQLQHFAEVEPTDRSHNVVISDITLDGESVPTGWEIGVYTLDDILAGSVIWYDDRRVAVNAWSDDPQTDEVEGFTVGQTITFRVWDNQTDTEYYGMPIIEDGSIVWTLNAITVLSLEAMNLRPQSIDLNAGWSIISLNINPTNEYYGENNEPGPEIDLMLEQLAYEGGHHVVLFKSDAGRFYSPEFGFGNILYWDLEKGYSINVDEDVNLRWLGTPIPEDTPITIPENWSMIAYYPTYDLSARGPDYYVLASILDDLLMAKNARGQFMLPSLNFSNMAAWTPGQGYKVRMLNEVEFTYPEPQQVVAMVDEVKETDQQDHYPEMVNTGLDMSVLVLSVSGQNIAEGNQIAAYNSDGEIIGVGDIDERGRCGLAVWGDDLTTENVDGLQEGESFELRYWDNLQKQEIPLMVQSFSRGTDLRFEADGFVALTLQAQPEIPEDYYLSEAYPNPFNSTTHISFGLPEDGQVQISLFDLSGRMVAEVANGRYTAGHHHVSIDAGSFPSGVYMLNMQSDGLKTARKIVLVR